MTPQELKNSILQLAIQGKLVEQRAEEGTGRELLEKILATKNAEGAKGREIKLTRSRGVRGGSEDEGISNLPKAAKSHHGKLSALSASPREEIPDDEKPFDIPESWEWVRLGDLVIKDIKRGKSPTYTQKSGTLVFAQKCNTKAGVINLSLALFLDEAKLSKYPESEFMRDCDIVINSTGNGTLGRVGIYRDSDNPNKLPVVPDSHVTVIRVGEKVSVEYVFYCLKHYQPLLEKLCSGSTNQTELSASTVKSLLFPLPPLAEQKRIVAKIEELLPLIDRYEKAWSRLEDFNKHFPADMQKSLLQMAIQGKLVEQRAEEGTGRELLEKILAAKNAKDAKGKEIKFTRSRGVRGGSEDEGISNLPKAAKSHHGKLSALSASPREEIPDDEKPFDIPESWEWVRLGDIVEIYTGKRDANFGSSEGEYDFFTCSNQPIKCSSYSYDGEFLIMPGNGANIGMVIHYKGKFEAYQRTYLLENRFGVFMDYLECHLKANWKQYNADKMYGSAIPYIKLGNLTNYLVAIPPLAEQKRIVAKLEELLPLCERLKAKSGELSQPEQSKRSEV